MKEHYKDNTDRKIIMVCKIALIATIILFLYSIEVQARPLSYIIANNSIAVNDSVYWDDSGVKHTKSDWIDNMITAINNNLTNNTYNYVIDSLYGLGFNHNGFFNISYDNTTISFVPSAIFLKSNPATPFTPKLTRKLLLESDGKFGYLTYSFDIGTVANYNLTYNGNNDTFKEIINIKTKPNFVNTANGNDTIVVKHKLKYTNLTAVINGTTWDGNITNISTLVFTKNNETYYTFTPPYAVDSIGNKTNLDYNISSNGSTNDLFMGLSIAWLKNATYPIIIDPSLNVNAGTVALQYSSPTAEEISFNKFQTTFDTPNGLPTSAQMKGAIEAGTKISSNIIIDTVQKNGTSYTIIGHLINYSTRENMLFNPWWNSTWLYQYNNAPTNASRPYVYKLFIANNTVGFGNITHLNITCLQDGCSDIRFVQDNATVLPYYREVNTSTNGTGYGTYWFNLTSNASGFQIYSGASGVTDLSNKNDTFISHDLSNVTKVDPGSKITFNATTATVNAEISGTSRLYKTVNTMGDFKLDFEFYITNAGDWHHQCIAYLSNSTTQMNDTSFHGVGAYLDIGGSGGTVWRIYANKVVAGVVTNGDLIDVGQGTLRYATMTRAGTTLNLKVYSDSTRTSQVGATAALTVPNSTYNILHILNNDPASLAQGSFYVQNVTLSNYAAAEPTWAAWGTNSGNQQPTFTSLTLTPTTRKYNHTININASGISDNDTAFINLYRLQVYWINNSVNTYLTNTSWYPNTTTFINTTITVPWTTGNTYTIYGEIYDNGGNAPNSNLTSTNLSQIFTLDTTAPNVSSASLSTSSITTGDSINITAIVNTNNANISSATVRIERPDATVADWAMTCAAAENVTCFKLYTSTSSVGTYYVRFVNVTDDASLSSANAFSLTFTASATSSSSSGGGGGGGGSPTIASTSTPLQSSVNLSVLGITEGARSISDIDVINKCLTDSFLLSSQCTNAVSVVMKDQTNWYTILGAYIAAVMTIFGLNLIVRKRRSYFDAAIYGTIVVISMLAANLMGFNFTFLWNYVFNNSLSAYTFFSFMTFGFIGTVLMDEYVFTKPAIYTVRKIRI